MPKADKFRLNCKNVFLTWPHCDKEPTEVYEAIVAKFTLADLKYVCVAKEQHKDGTPHIHVAITFNSKCDIRSSSTLDDLVGQHGNYQSARNIIDVIKYIKKDNVFIEHGEQPTKQQKISLVVAQTLREGKTIDEVEDIDPGYFMLHMPRIIEYKLYLSTKQLRQQSIPEPLEIQRWNFDFRLGFPRSFKEPQYWIYGPPNTGKTSFMIHLEEIGFRAFIMPINNDFKGYDDAAYDFAYIDEFKGQFTIQFLNEWLQGSKMKLNTKYGGVFKNKNIPTFILSNFSPENCFKNQDSENLAPLLTRLHVIYTGNSQ